VAEAHGGSVGVASAPGGGALFRLSLPSRAVAPAGPAQTPAPVGVL
jgi:signal transduction histidine kinase